MKNFMAWILASSVVFTSAPMFAFAATASAAKAEANALCEKTWKNSTHADDKGIKDFLAKSCNKNAKSKQYWECVAKLVAQGNSVSFSASDTQCPMK